MGEIILVVEDRADTRNMISFALKKEGYSVMEAEDGKMALELINTKNIDLILLDLLMPKVSGEEVLKQLRAKKENNKIKVIILTASKVSDSMVASFKKIGANEFLLKPINVGSLMDTIKKMLNK